LIEFVRNNVALF